MITLTIKGLRVTLSINDNEHKRHSALQHADIMLSVTFYLLLCFMLYAECCYAECRYVECSNAEYRYTECRYAQCCYAECIYGQGSYAEYRYTECHYAGKSKILSWILKKDFCSKTTLA
jgi:hypothetical protein